MIQILQCSCLQSLGLTMIAFNSAKFVKVFSGTVLPTMKRIQVLPFAVSKVNSKPLYCFTNSTRSYGTPLSESEISIDKYSTKHKKLISFFSEIVKGYSELASSFSTPEVGDHITKVLEHVGSEGKQFRGMLTVYAYENMVPPRLLTEESLRLVNLLAWCNDLLHYSILIADDVMDDSLSRRNKICWHKVEGVGMSSINDSLLLQRLIFRFLRERFHHLVCYEDLRNLLEESLYICSLGQCLDHLASNQSTEKFTLERYEKIAEMKTAFDTTFQSVVLGMALAGITDRNIIAKIKPILIELGRFYQIRDDYLDAFVEDKSDIKERKLTWLAAKCMERGTETQKNTLIKYYGRKDSESVDIVMNLFQEMGLDDLFLEYEKVFVDNLMLKARNSLNDEYFEMISGIINMGFRVSQLL